MIKNLMNLGFGNQFLASSPVSVINGVMNDMKGWIIGIFLAVVVVVILTEAVKYQTGGDDEKLKAKKNIKRNLTITGGVFVFIWLAAYLFQKFSVLK